MFKLFIKRPILSGVISVIIVCLGVLSILTLPITQFPDIVPPSVTVTARYTGASADVMSKTVATPLERAINGVPGMTYMTTVCTNDGMSLTTNILFTINYRIFYTPTRIFFIFIFFMFFSKKTP